MNDLITRFLHWQLLVPACLAFALLKALQDQAAMEKRKPWEKVVFGVLFIVFALWAAGAFFSYLLADPKYVGGHPPAR